MNEEDTERAAVEYAAVKRRVVRGRTPWRRIYSCIEPSSLLYVNSTDSQGWDSRFNNFRRYAVAGNYAGSLRCDQNNNKQIVRMNTTRHITLDNDWSDIRTLQNRDVSVNFSNPRKFLDLESAAVTNARKEKRNSYDAKAARRRRHTVSRIEYSSPFQPISEANEEKLNEAVKIISGTEGVNQSDCSSKLDKDRQDVLQKNFNGNIGKQDANAGPPNSDSPFNNATTIIASSDCKGTGSTSEYHDSRSKAKVEIAAESYDYSRVTTDSKTEEMEIRGPLVEPEKMNDDENVISIDRNENAAAVIENVSGNENGSYRTDVVTAEEEDIEDVVRSTVSAIIDKIYLAAEEDNVSLSSEGNESRLSTEKTAETCGDFSEISEAPMSPNTYSRRVSEPIMRLSNCHRRTKPHVNGHVKLTLKESTSPTSSPLYDSVIDNEGYKRLYQLAVAAITKNTKKIPRIADFIALLQSKGIWLSDPRLKKTYFLVENEKCKEETELTEEVFTRISSPAILFIRNVLLSQMTIPGFTLFGNRMSQVFQAMQSSLSVMERCGGREDAGVDPTSNYLDFMRSRRSTKTKSINISVCTVDGQRLSFGDNDIYHSLDVCANILNYCIACSRNGIEVAKSHIGKTALRPPQDEFSFDGNGKVLNPFTKAGSMVTSALLSQNEPIESCISELHDVYSKAMGEEAICCDNLSYNLKRLYAHEEISLAYFLSARQKLPKMYNKTPGEILELNFQSSSTATTADTCSVAAATLAAGGVCPLTGEAVFKEDVVRHVLKRMRASNVLQHQKNGKEHDAISSVCSESGAMFLVVPGVLGLVCFVQSLPRNTVSSLSDCLIQNLTTTFNFSVYRNLKRSRHIN